MSFHHTSSQFEQANFRHLVFDIAWFGLALAATSRFLSVYAIRLGASPTEIGLITALPSLILLFSSGLGGVWQRRYTTRERALSWPGLGMRLMFILPAFAPLLPEHLRPLWLIISISLPAIPQGIAGVVFMDMMRGSVSQNTMPRLLSHRALWLNIMLALGALAFGILLEKAPYPLNYQIMFGVAFIAAMFSFKHCNAIRTDPLPANNTCKSSPFSPWKSPKFRQVALVTSVVQITFTFLVSVTPIFLVAERGATEGFMAVFGMIELGAGALMAVLTPRIVRKIGNRAMIAIMMFGTAIAAVIFALSPNLYLTLIGAAISGGCWAAAAMIGLFGFFTENTPVEDSAAYATAYQQVIGFSAFLGPMIGSLLVSGGISLVTVMLVGAVLRAGSALVVEYPLLTRYRRHELAEVQA
ncbi:MAG: major facilitator transporter [Chloroflexi bacterium OLB15]|nr:MAG: major facilitator transporter [Chloroflexi bacterium OLB15]